MLGAWVSRGQFVPTRRTPRANPANVWRVANVAPFPHPPVTFVPRLRIWGELDDASDEQKLETRFGSSESTVDLLPPEGRPLITVGAFA